MKNITHSAIPSQQIIYGFKSLNFKFLNTLLLSAFCFLLFSLVQGQVSTDNVEEMECEKANCSKGGYGCSHSVHNNRNINCPLGLNWHIEKDAIVRIEDTEGYFFSGALINTTANGSDNRHYILTAGHCLENYYYPNETLKDWKFYWHYESPKCAVSISTDPEPPHIYTTGAKIVAKYPIIQSSREVDFALIELFDDPAEAWDVVPYYLGWDRSDDQDFATIIHHPKGDIKKIMQTGTFYKHWLYVPSWCWEFYHSSNYIMQSGSSGSPLLNDNHKLIGIHVQGPIPMGSNGAPAYRNSRFDVAWDYPNFTTTPTTRLRDWLDPLGTTQMTLDGRGGCQKTIKLDKMLSASRPFFHAVQNIISKQKIESEHTIVYKAGNDIHLIEGFHAKAGSNFHALIETLEGCDQLTPPPPPPPKSIQNETITTKEIDSDSFQLFPNPATNTVTIEGAGIAQVEVYDVYGRKLLEQKAERRTQKGDGKFPSNSLEGWQPQADGVVITVSSLPAGVYLVKIYSENNQTFVKRLVITK